MHVINNLSLEGGGGGGVSSYEISSLEGLENSAGKLASFNQQISNNTKSLQYILNSINENWQNEQGQDIESIVTNLNAAIKTLSEDIQPVITTYVQTLNKIVAETRANQNRTLY